jgi:hypothetical protein
MAYMNSERQNQLDPTIRALGGMKLLGLMNLQSVPAPGETAFARGTSPADLDMADVITAFHDAHTIIKDSWDLLTPESLSKAIVRTMPDGTDNVGGAVRFLAWHETYHLGQLALFRRFAGKPGFA